MLPCPSAEPLGGRRSSERASRWVSTPGPGVRWQEGWACLPRHLDLSSKNASGSDGSVLAVLLWLSLKRHHQTHIEQLALFAEALWRIESCDRIHGVRLIGFTHQPPLISSSSCICIRLLPHNRSRKRGATPLTYACRPAELLDHAGRSVYLTYA